MRQPKPPNQLHNWLITGYVDVTSGRKVVWGKANALSGPPAVYGRKTEKQRDGRGLTRSVDYVV